MFRPAPSASMSSAMEGGRFDPRRWHGRSADACVQAYNKARSQCAQFEGCWSRVDEANLTGGVSGDEKIRCATLLFNKGGSSSSRFYDVIRNPSFNIGRPFQFHEVWSWMRVHTELLQLTQSLIPIANAVTYDGQNGDEDAVCKPAGTKINDIQLSEEGPAENLQVRAEESVDMRRFPINSSKNGNQANNDGIKIRPVGTKSAKKLRKRDDEKCTDDDIVILRDTITSWRSEVSRQMNESRASNTALEESKMNQEQFVADIDAYKVLFKSEAGASATEIKEVAAVLQEECLSRVRSRKRARENQDSRSELDLNGSNSTQD
jgi:hypothetical protein